MAAEVPPNTTAATSSAVVSPPVTIITTPFPASHKLNNKNFPQWRSLVMAILNGHDLLSHVDGSLAPPAISDSAYKSWFRQDQLVYAFLQGSLTDEVSPFVTSYTSSYDAWTGLHAIFASRSRSRVMQLKGDLQHAKMGSKKIAEYMHYLKAKADELALIDSPVSDDDFTLYVLGGLTPKFRDISASIRAQTSAVSFPQLLDLLVAQEQYLDAQEEPAPEVSVSVNAAQTRNGGNSNRGRAGANRGRGGTGRGRNQRQMIQNSPNPNGGNFFNPRQPRITCQWCQGPGHTVRSCWQFPQNASANIVRSPNQNFNSNTWLLDSEATHNITNDLGNMSLHSEYDGTEEVHLTDGSTVPITHTGSSHGGAHNPRTM